MGDLHSCGEVAGPEETDVLVSSSESAEYPPPLLNSTVRKCLRSVYTSVKILQKKGVVFSSRLPAAATECLVFTNCAATCYGQNPIFTGAVSGDVRYSPRCGGSWQ